jgi:UDP-glucose 4-epimerase
MKILIAGGTGYIGGTLVDRLAKSGHKVTVLTRKLHGSYPKIMQVNYAEVDWINFNQSSEHFTGIDTVINAAGITSSDGANNSVATKEFSDNVTKKIIDAASVAEVRLFIHLSSIHVYGNNLKGNVTESNTIDESLPYAKGHVENEKLVQDSALLKGIVLRLSNVFGKPSLTQGDCWNLATNEMCREAILKKTITLRSSGKQYRNFLPISELSKRIEDLINITQVENLPNTINVGGTSTISILEMAKLIQSRCEKKFSFSPAIRFHSTKETENQGEFSFHSSYSKHFPDYSAVTVENEIDSMLLYLLEDF